jgi:hypothetical protein
MVQELVDAGSLTEQEAAGHPDANKITRALGMTEEVEVEVRAEPMELYADDIFLLATDGLTDLVTSEEILQLTLAAIEAAEPQRACDELVALANERGGHDNITVQVIHVLATGPKRSRTLAQEPTDFVDESDRGALGPPEPLPGDDTVPDDGGPTVPDPAPSDNAPTEVREPPSRVATTAPDPPSPTIPAEPRKVGSRDELATTAPDRPQPTVVDPALAIQHARAVGPPPASVAPRPTSGRVQAGSADRDETRPLVLVVVVMALVIAVLVVLLLWLTLGR